MRPNHTKNINKNHNPIINKLTFFFGREKHNQIKYLNSRRERMPNIYIYNVKIKERERAQKNGGKQALEGKI